MTQERLRAGNRLSRADGYQLGRFALAGLLILLATALLRAGLPGLALDGPDAHDELPVAAALEAVIIVLLALVVARRRRAPAGHLATRLRDVLRSVLIAAAIAVPCSYLLTRAVHFKVRTPAPVSPTRGQLPPRVGIPGEGHAAPFIGSWFDLLLAAVLVAAIVGCSIILARRHWPQRRVRRPAPEFTDDGDAELRKAVEYGWLALRELDDARGAIIACYLAMEQSLAQAGTSRGTAETPAELLARAAAKGLVRGTAAARLTSAFYEARFSTMELTVAHRDTAEQALAELSAGLSEAAQ
jgi:hypothetical protein